MLVFNSAAAEHSLRQAGIPISLLLAGMIILGLLYFLSGLGMLAGKKWGWWLAVFYYVYSVARHANALFLLEDMAEQLGAPEGGLVRFQIKYGVRIVFALLVLVYLFREPVRIYFRLEQTSKLRAIGTVVGVCLALWSAISGALILMAD
ncbi:MAG: hypothetical protein C0485_05245 [Pirellula sp.]|nr:hypothetical protein [Pirellula sp.]